MLSEALEEPAVWTLPDTFTAEPVDPDALSPLELEAGDFIRRRVLEVDAQFFDG